MLYKAGLHNQFADVSGTLESYGEQGPGQWITIYANSEHVFLVIAGLAFDTADFGGPNIPAGSGPRWRQNPLGNLSDGSQLRRPAPRGAVAMRRKLTALALVLAAVALAGCGIGDPYQSPQPSTSASTASTTPTSSTPAAQNADPAPERNGTIPAQAQAAQNQLAAGAAQTTPQAALERYARIYLNWTTATVVAIQHQLASISTGQARALAQQAAATAGRDTQLKQEQIANSGQVISLARRCRAPRTGSG